MTSLESQNATGQPEDLKANLAAVAQRLAKLETQRTWVLFIAVLALGFGGASLLYAAKSSIPTDQASPAAGRVLEAGELILRDKSGRKRVVLTALDDAPMLGLYDEAGVGGVGLLINKDGPALGLMRRNGNFGAVLHLFDDSPLLSFEDRAGKSRMLLELDKNTDRPRLSLTDAHNKSELSVAMTDAGPQVALMDANGTKRTALAHVPELGSALVFWDFNGKYTRGLSEK